MPIIFVSQIKTINKQIELNFDCHNLAIKISIVIILFYNVKTL